jgi:fructokinase
MSTPSKILVFGEVLFDCFPTGEQVLGGAPFNVAWHLQALGDAPGFLSRVGSDEQGDAILSAMEEWGMSRSAVQTDSLHQTGRVDVEVVHHEPHYTIVPDCAYDFIDGDALGPLPDSGILYHGTLGLRNTVSRNALVTLAGHHGLSRFLDVNLRAPWWQKEEVYRWLQGARWVKLNRDELRLLGFTASDHRRAMEQLQAQFPCDQLILTRGEQGATVLSREGRFYDAVPEKAGKLVDTVGAGDAFSAVYIHGLMAGWTIPDILRTAQRFAGRVIGLRGATTTDRAFYREFSD